MNANEDAIEMPEEELIAPPADLDAEANDEDAEEAVTPGDEADVAESDRS